MMRRWNHRPKSERSVTFAERGGLRMMMKGEKMEGRLGAGGTVLAKNKKENGRKSQKSAALKQERGEGAGVYDGNVFV